MLHNVLLLLLWSYLIVHHVYLQAGGSDEIEIFAPGEKPPSVSESDQSVVVSGTDEVSPVSVNGKADNYHS